MKRKLIVEEWLSLDGHVSDKTGSLDFFSKHVRDSYTTSYRESLLDSIDTIIFGQKTYSQFSALWPGRSIDNDVLAEKMNTLNKIVFSKSLQQAPWGNWKEALIDSGDPVKKIKQLKSVPGKNLVVWGSITLAQALIESDEVDEFHLHICPVLTGGGRSLFANETKMTNLTLLESNQFENSIVLHKYGRFLK